MFLPPNSRPAVHDRIGPQEQFRGRQGRSRPWSQIPIFEAQICAYGAKKASTRHFSAGSPDAGNSGVTPSAGMSTVMVTEPDQNEYSNSSSSSSWSDAFD